MKKLLSRTLSTLLLTSAIALTTAIAGGLIVVSVIGPKPVFDAVSCQLGLSDHCLQNELDRERQNLKKLRARAAKLEALYERLSKLDHASSSYAVFYHDKTGKFTVSTGIEYVSLIKPDALQSGWCYVQLQHDGLVDTNLHIAAMDEKRNVTHKTIPSAHLRKLGLTRTDVAQALKRCQWPGDAR